MNDSSRATGMMVEDAIALSQEEAIETQYILRHGDPESIPRAQEGKA